MSDSLGYTVTLGSVKPITFKTKHGDVPSASVNVLIGGPRGDVIFALYGVLVSKKSIQLPKVKYGTGIYFKTSKVSYEVAEKIYEALAESPLTEGLIPATMEKGIKDMAYSAEEFAKDWGSKDGEN